MNTKKIIRRAFARTLSRGLRNTVTVTLRYETGRVVGDINDASTWSGVAVKHAVPVKALVHFISPATILNRGFIELRTGDAIVDFPPAQSFEGMQNLLFEIDGRRFAQKSVGKEVERYYDLIVGDERMFRTVALSPLPEAAAEPLTGMALRFIDGSGSAVIWTFDPGTGDFTAPGESAGRIGLPGAGGGYAFRLLVAGTLALAITADGIVHVRGVEALNDSYQPGTPRAEFWREGVRFASLTADGELAVPAVIEEPGDPELEEAFTLFNGPDWLASIAVDGLRAVGLDDGL